jgi:hypothetical protein
MVLHTHKTEPNHSTGWCAPEHGASLLKTLGFGADLRLFSGPSVGANEPLLPANSIVRKRMERIVQAGVSRMYPAFCTVTASGSNRRPAAGSFFCFGLRRLRLRFPSATDPP